ncbi:hybrid sensor histidine kinase/response regulator [Lutibacter sp. B2]|nr:hybrid sensor histidine kinase/response regulator [Lutibacter sp. B2]
MDACEKSKILIVDDSILNSRMISDVIKKNGYETVLVSKGKRTLQHVIREKPDLILLDIIMPEINGYEVCKLLKNYSKTKDIPVIFLTSQTKVEEIAKGFEVGAVDYINKPFNELELIARVKTHLQVKKLHDKLKESNEELKKTNEELTKANETIQYNKLQTEFFANISHEFKTPLNLIFSIIQLFEVYVKDGIPLKNSKHINIMKQNCYRLLRLVDNLIDMTKIDSGYFEIKLQNHNIVSMIEEIVLSISAYVKSNDINIIFDTDVEEKIIACDADNIERIILNLLSNAIKFTKPDGDIMVSIHDQGESIAISIKDTGEGMPQEKIDTIFDRFIQIDKSLSRKKEGSGIGLSIVKALVNMQDGEITVKSNPGRGTEFIIELPVKVLEEGDNTIQTNTYDKNNYIESINIEFSDIYSIGNMYK